MLRAQAQQREWNKTREAMIAERKLVENMRAEQVAAERAQTAHRVNMHQKYFKEAKVRVACRRSPLFIFWGLPRRLRHTGSNRRRRQAVAMMERQRESEYADKAFREGMRRLEESRLARRELESRDRNRTDREVRRFLWTTRTLCVNLFMCVCVCVKQNVRVCACAFFLCFVCDERIKSNSGMLFLRLWSIGLGGRFYPKKPSSFNTRGTRRRAWPYLKLRCACGSKCAPRRVHCGSWSLSAARPRTTRRKNA